MSRAFHFQALHDFKRTLYTSLLIISTYSCDFRHIVLNYLRPMNAAWNIRELEKMPNLRRYQEHFTWRVESAVLYVIWTVAIQINEGNGHSFHVSLLITKYKIPSSSLMLYLDYIWLTMPTSVLASLFS